MTAVGFLDNGELLPDCGQLPERRGYASRWHLHRRASHPRPQLPDPRLQVHPQQFPRRHHHHCGAPDGGLEGSAGAHQSLPG